MTIQHNRDIHTSIKSQSLGAEEWGRWAKRSPSTPAILFCLRGIIFIIHTILNIHLAYKLFSINKNQLNLLTIYHENRWARNSLYKTFECGMKRKYGFVCLDKITRVTTNLYNCWIWSYIFNQIKDVTVDIFTIKVKSNMW